MNLSEYQTATDLTARYPGAGTGSLGALTYLALGLAGESSEALEKHLEDDSRGVRAELGDTLWYLARLYRELGLPLPDLSTDTGDEPVTAAVGDALHRTVSTRLVSVGRVAEVVKKAARDDGQLTTERTRQLEQLLHVVAAAWGQTALAFALLPAAVAADNLAKLLDRRDRGVLAGSGDHR